MVRKPMLVRTDGPWRLERNPRGQFMPGGVAGWVASVLEIYEGEWFTIESLTTEIADRAGDQPSLWSVRQAIYRLVRAGTVSSRPALLPPSNKYGNAINGLKEYAWLR